MTLRGERSDRAIAPLLEENADDLYEHAPCGYLSALGDGTIVKVNRTFLDWTGYAREELVRVRRFQELLTPGGQIYHETHYAPLLRMQGAVRGIALQIRRADGSRLPVLINSVLRTNDQPDHTVIRTTVFDARDREAYEQELRRARRREAEANDELRTLNLELVEARRELERMHGEELAREQEAAHRLERELTAALEREESKARRLASMRGELLARLMRSQEEERTRVAADIHDDYLQGLISVAMQLERATEDVAGPTRELLESLRQELAVTVGRMRGLIFDLRPPALDWGGAAAAIRMQLEQLEAEWDISGQLDDRLRRQPEAAAQLAVYRIAQEALANVRKHAHASSVEVLLEERDGGVFTRVVDDGVGLTQDMRATMKGFGLATMRERAEAAGGWCTIESLDWGGTAVEFWLPA